MQVSHILFYFFPIIDAFSTPSLYNRFRRDAGPAASSLDFTALSASLRQAFPSSTHNHPAYASVLHLFDSLATSPSCQRIATSAFVSECSQLMQATSADIKIHYAVELAVCEFESTGATFPSECQLHGNAIPGYSNGRGGMKRIQACLRKLEERPQWWTTLSNNLQNAIVICSAVRHDVEEDNLLNLYRNVTKAQQILAEVLETSIQNSWNEIKEYHRRSTELKARMDVMQDGVLDAGRLASTSLEKHAERIEDVLNRLYQSIDQALTEELVEMSKIIEATQHIRESTDQLSTDISDASVEVQKAFRHMTANAQNELHRFMLLLEQSSDHTISQFRKNYNEASTNMMSLASTAVDVGRRLQVMEQVVMDIALSHARIIEVQDSLFSKLKQQDEAQGQLQEGLNKAISKFDMTIERLLSSADTLAKTLDETEVRVQMLGVHNPIWLWIGICAIGLVLLLGPIYGKLVIAVITATAGSMMLLRAQEIHQIIQFGTGMLFHQYTSGESSLETLVHLDNNAAELGGVTYQITGGFVLCFLCTLIVSVAIWLPTIYRSLRRGAFPESSVLPIPNEAKI